MRRRSLEAPSTNTTIYRPPLISSSRYSKTSNPASKSINLENSEIYFNEESRRVHIRSIIDSYFESHTTGQVSQKPEQTQTKPVQLRRRASLINRNCSDRLANTCPQPFYPMSHSDVAQFNKTFLSDQSLPPIAEATDDPEIANSSLYNMSLSTLIEEARHDEKSRLIENSAFIKRRPKLVAENQMYKLTYIYQGQSKMPVYMIKEYKHQCKEIFIRQQKVWALLSSLQVRRMWATTGLLSCQARPLRSFKSMLMQITRESVMSENVYKINLKPYYDQIFSNDNQIIKYVVHEICKQLSNIKGKVINNKINLSNIYKDEDDIFIGQWGHSALMESAKIASQTVKHVVNPVLKGFREWFVTPQYLPPELLQHVTGEKQYNMWDIPSATDIWSLGCLLLQILTLVPLWSPLRCQISNRAGLTRRGLFLSKARELPEIIIKQKKFCSNLKLHLDRFAQVDSRASKKVVDVMIKMLQVDPSCRPTPEQVISLLN